MLPQSPDRAIVGRGGFGHDDGAADQAVRTRIIGGARVGHFWPGFTLRDAWRPGLRSSRQGGGI